MIVGVLTTCHTKYTWDSSICFFLLNTPRFCYMPYRCSIHVCALCDSTNINTIIEFVPNCLQHVSGDGFNGGSDSYRQLSIYRASVRYVTKTWSLVVLNKKNIFCYLKCIVYDKLLKPRQSFRITLYLNVKTAAHVLALALLK